MAIIRNPELRGILVLILIVVLLAGILAGSTGKLEQWFGITLFSGPRVLDKIIFVSDRSGTNEIYSMNLDGYGQRRLTSGARVTSVPAISATGSRIAFTGILGNAVQVLSVSAGGGAPEQLTTATGPKSQPSYSPDGKRTAFIVSGKVYVADLDGGNLDPVLPSHEETHAAMVGRNQMPAYTGYAWGPDSRSLMGVTKDGENDVLVYLPELEGKPVRMALAPPSMRGVRVNGIAWAAKKPMLAASIKIGKSGALAIFDAESKQLQPVTVQKGIEFGKPALSPDGSVLVVPGKSFVKGDPGGLLKIDLESQNGGLLAKGEFENLQFSAKGDRILATQVDSAQDKRDVVSIDVSTGNVKQLTTDGGSFNAIWSPSSEE
ncbi:MAG: DPP IV N-terminal domain-containing protein [Armatimonadetes bacterium]|nr:DPP IV N-terminal domain-containing protein [Armatimonadota bacterium]